MLPVIETPSSGFERKNNTIRAVTGAVTVSIRVLARPLADGFAPFGSLQHHLILPKFLEILSKLSMHEQCVPGSFSQPA